MIKLVITLGKFISALVKVNFGKRILPFKYFLVVTKSCQSRCINCHIWKEKVENELTIDEYRQLAKNSANNLFWLNISGGEPTDREDLTLIIDQFVQHCPNLQVLNFTSNGLNLDALKDCLDYLQETNIFLIGINISIDGPPNTHDLIRGIPDGFKKAIEAYKLVKKYPRIKSSIAMTLFPQNFKMIGETIEAIKKEIPEFKKQDLHLNFPHSSAHYYKNEAIQFDHRIDMNYVTPYLKKASFFTSPTQLVEIIYQRYLIRFHQTKKTPIPCAALSSNLYISEKGDIYPCTIWDKKIQSLRENYFDIKHILDTPEIKKTLEDIKNHDCPNCWTPCEAFPSIISNLKSVL